MFPRFWVLIDLLQMWVEFDWTESAHEYYLELRATGGLSLDEDDEFTTAKYAVWLMSITEFECMVRLTYSEAWPYGYFEVFNMRITTSV